MIRRHMDTLARLKPCPARQRVAFEGWQDSFRLLSWAIATAERFEQNDSVR